MATTWSTSSPGRRRVDGDADGPSLRWWLPGHRNVAPDADERPEPSSSATRAAARSARSALADDPRSRRTPFGIRTALRSAVEVKVSEPGDRAEISHRLAAEPRSVRSHGHSRAPPWRCPTVGSTAPWVRLGHRVGDIESFEEQGGDFDRCGPALAWRCASSESARKRLQARSMASTSSRSTRSRVVCVRRIRHDDGGRRAQGAEGSRREAGLRRRHGGRTHREVPPEVTTGRLRRRGGRRCGGRGGRWRRGRRCRAVNWHRGPMHRGVEVLGVEVVGVSAGAGGGPAGPRVLVRDHHADGDGGSGGQPTLRHGSGVARGRRRDRRVSGELGCGVELTGHVLGSASFHGSSGA